MKSFDFIKNIPLNDVFCNANNHSFYNYFVFCAIFCFQIRPKYSEKEILEKKYSPDVVCGLERVHIKRASKIKAKVMTEKYIISSLS